MPEVYFSDSAISAITGFIRAYEEAFFELYRDSGLLNERQIVNNYRLSAKLLSEEIFFEIERHLGDRRVLGRKENERWQELTFYVKSRLITVYYTDGDDDRRLVEMIGIERKPIIF